ncbi:Uncharacterised protein [Mycobacteroides abscessus]|nr:Uncharacterised protein [Mycobacteroides abscessus]SLE38720.1 Uncharacterised protein [Mycobacteroides abscessus subsp. massiliense]
MAGLGERDTPAILTQQRYTRLARQHLQLLGYRRGREAHRIRHLSDGAPVGKFTQNPQAAHIHEAKLHE